MQKRLGLIIAILVAVFAAFIVLRISSSPTPPPPANAGLVAQPSQSSNVDTINVYVASGYIPIGTRIEENMLDSQPWPEHLVVDGFITASRQAEELINTVTRSEFQEGEPFIASKLANPNDPNFIAGALPKGMRLVTMPTDVVSGLAGFIYPGDQVDVLLTHEVFPDGVTPATPRYRDFAEEVSEVLISNAKVMAVDQSASVSTEGEQQAPSTVSIAVTPEDAQKLVLGVQVGEVSLALRSLNDKATLENIAVTRTSDLTQGGAAPTKAPATFSEEERPVIVVRGVEVEEGTEEQTASGALAPFAR